MLEMEKIMKRFYKKYEKEETRKLREGLIDFAIKKNKWNFEKKEKKKHT